MAKTFIPTVYLIDDRPGEETTCKGNTVEGIAAFKQVMPHLRECTKEEYQALNERIREIEAQS